VATGGDDALGFPPDAVWSYEIGAKHGLLGGRVHVESTVFHIRWTNDQPDAVLPSNCGSRSTPRVTAASNGFELLVQALLTEHSSRLSALFTRTLATLRRSKWETP